MRAASSFDWLEDSYAKDSDRVDLLYAILHCHSWIRSDERCVVVRLEPLQQPARRYAQEQLCRKLSGLGAKIPGGEVAAYRGRRFAALTMTRVRAVQNPRQIVPGSGGSGIGG
jgi:hypothetical protein